MEPHLMPLLLRGRCVLPGDVDHPSANVFDAEARAPVMGAEVIHQSVVVETNEHGRDGSQYGKGRTRRQVRPTLLGDCSNPRAPAASGPAVIASSGPPSASLITWSVVHSNGSLGRGS